MHQGLINIVEENEMYIKVLKYNVIHLVTLQWKINCKKTPFRKKKIRVDLQSICGALLE